MDSKGGRLPLLFLMMEYVESCGAFRTKCIQVTQSLQDLYEKVCLREVRRRRAGQVSLAAYRQADLEGITLRLPLEIPLPNSGHRTCEPTSKINGITFLSSCQLLREGSGNGNPLERESVGASTCEEAFTVCLA